MTTAQTTPEPAQNRRTRRAKRRRFPFVRRATTVALPLAIEEIVWEQAQALDRPITDIVVAVLADHWADRLPCELVEALQLTPKNSAESSRRISADALLSLDEQEIQKTAAEAA